MQPTPRCLYYAFGGGMGHGIRTIALARQVARQLGGCHRILLNSPFAEVFHTLVDAEPLLQVCTLSADADATAAGAFIRQALQAFPPDLFIVDTFPRGLGGELAGLETSWPARLSVLVSRTLPAAYVRRYDLARFTARHYHLLIAPGEDSPLSEPPQVYRTAPFLLRQADELPCRKQAARLLAACADQATILVVGSGTPSECQEAHDLVQAMLRWRLDPAYALRLAVPLPHLLVRRPGVVRLVRHLPLLDCLSAVRLIIGAGGYNLLHESAALQVPAIFWPRPRQYDNQFRRVAPYASVTSLAALRQAVESELQHPCTYPGIPAYANGAVEAAALIRRMWQQRLS